MAKQDPAKPSWSPLTSPNGTADGGDGQEQVTSRELDKLSMLTYPYIVEREAAVLKSELGASRGEASGDQPSVLPGQLGRSQFLAANSPTGRLSSGQLQARREQVERLFADYLSDVQALGIASAVLVGSRVGQRQGYIWNVFSNDFTPEQGLDSCLRALNSRAYQFQRALSGIVPLRIAHANPSQLEVLRDRCRQRNIDTELVAF